jgi:hypothetical protein
MKWAALFVVILLISIIGYLGHDGWGIVLLSLYALGIIAASLLALLLVMIVCGYLALVWLYLGVHSRLGGALKKLFGAKQRIG